MIEQGPERDVDPPGPPEEQPADGEGIDVTMGEPNTFEPEEDPDS